MFDNVTLKVYDLPESYNLFDNANIKHDKYGDPYKGILKNMLIWQYPDFLKITGSLPKYLRGENITPLKREEVKQAIKKLEKDIGLSLENAIVSSVEFGTSVKVKELSCEYMFLFGHINRLDRHLFSYGNINQPFRDKVSNRNGLETLTYTTRTGSYKFIVYNKIREILDNKGVIPLSFEDCNVLRLEYKILDREGIKKQFNGNLTAYRLFYKKYYRRFQELFYKQYKSIGKMGRLVYVNKSKEITPRIFTKIMAEQYRQSYPEEYQQHFQRFIEAGKISSKKTLEQIKAENNRLGNDGSFSDTNLLIKELDDLVYNSVMLGD